MGENDILKVELLDCVPVGRDELLELWCVHGGVADLHVTQLGEVHGRAGRRARERRHGRCDLMEELLCLGRCEEGIISQGDGTRAPMAEPCEAHLLQLRGEVTDIVVNDLEVIKARRGAVEVPTLDRDVELLDLGPAASSRRDAAEAGDVAQVVESARVHLGQGQLAEPVQGRTLQGDAQADEGIVDAAAPVPLLGVLARAPDGQVAQVGQGLDGVDEAGHIGSSMEERRILLSQDIAQLGVGVLAPGEDRAHACVRCVEEGDLIAGQGVDEGREEGRLGVWEVEGEVLDVVTDAGEGIDTGLLGEGVGVEGDVDAGEERLGEDLAVGVAGGTDGADVGGREIWEEVAPEALALQEGGEFLFCGGRHGRISWGGRTSCGLQPARSPGRTAEG